MLSLVVSLPQFHLPSWDYRLAIIGPLHLDIAGILVKLHK